MLLCAGNHASTDKLLRQRGWMIWWLGPPRIRSATLTIFRARWRRKRIPRAESSRMPLTPREGSAESPNTATTYNYDGEGRRLHKITTSGTTTYVYDAMGHLGAEYGGSSTSARRVCLSVDALGSTRLVTDASGNPIEQYDYAPFGGELTQGYRRARRARIRPISIRRRRTRSRRSFLAKSVIQRQPSTTSGKVLQPGAGTLYLLVSALRSWAARFIPVFLRATAFMQ